GAPPASAAPPPATMQPPAPTPAAPPVAVPAAAHRFSGTLTIDGFSAPAGTVVEAFVGDRACGRARVSQQGRYSIDVTGAGCGVDGADVRFGVTPAFGRGWQINSGAAFQPGGATTRNLAVDLRRIPADAENVPWNSTSWAQITNLRVGVCGDTSEAVDTGALAAFRQWNEAARGE